MPAHILKKILNMDFLLPGKFVFQVKTTGTRNMYRAHPFIMKAKIVSALVLGVSTFQRPYGTDIRF